MIHFLKKVPIFSKIAQKINDKLYARYLPVYMELIGNKDLSRSVTPAQKEESEVIQDTILQYVPPGHYYSPIPSPQELAPDRERIFSKAIRELPGIKISDEAMLERLTQFGLLIGEYPFTSQSNEGFRYYEGNGACDWGEAVVIYSIMRLYQPKRIIEVGSGFSSALMLDLNELFLSRKTEMMFIDPYTERLEELLRPGDRRIATVVRKRLQDMDLSMFQTLDAGDIAFFDSTHVCKCNSDVNTIFFEVLPRLKTGVFIHFHDVFYPFEYPREWVMDMGVAWNENYVLHAFLEFNNHFEIFFFNDYMSHHFLPQVEATFKQSGRWLGSSIWLRKVE